MEKHHQYLDTILNKLLISQTDKTNKVQGLILQMLNCVLRLCQLIREKDHQLASDYESILNLDSLSKSFKDHNTLLKQIVRQMAAKGFLKELYNRLIEDSNYYQADIVL